MHDDTEAVRQAMVAEINVGKGRAELEAEHGQVWDTQELQRDFEVRGFLAPFVEVMRKADRVRGCMTFQHAPRFYFGFEPYSG